MRCALHGSDNTDCLAVSLPLGLVRACAEGLGPARRGVREVCLIDARSLQCEARELDFDNQRIGVILTRRGHILRTVNVNLARRIDPEVVAVLRLQVNLDVRGIRLLPARALVQNLVVIHRIAAAQRLDLQSLVADRTARVYGSRHLDADGLNRFVCISGHSECRREEHHSSCQNGSLYDMFHCHFPL